MFVTDITEMNDTTKQWIKDLCKDETIEDLCVTFTKTDGTNRELYCTLSESSIPTDKKPKGTGPAKVTDAVQRVFDIENQEWRSFKWDSVKQVSFNLK